MQIAINEMVAHEASEINEIAHIFYDARADENGLTPAECDKVIKLILKIAKGDGDIVEKNSLSYLRGYDDGYDELASRIRSEL